MIVNDLPSLKDLVDNFRYDPNSGILYRKYKNVETTTVKNKTTGYYWICYEYKKYAAHRIIWKLYYGADVPNDMQIDHINGDRADNRISNLRLVTMNENMMNKKIYKSNKSGIVGVAKRSDTGSWRAQISVNGKAIKLGSFKTKEEAITARLAAEKRYGFHSNHGAR